MISGLPLKSRKLRGNSVVLLALVSLHVACAALLMLLEAYIQKNAVVIRENEGLVK